MKILIPVDGSQAALAPVEHVVALHRSGVALEVIVLNVQPLLSRHIGQFSSRSTRDAWRAERSRLAMAPAIEALSRARVPFRTITEVGSPRERVAAVAQREGAEEILDGVGRNPAWIRFALPAGIAGLAALLLSAE